VFVAFASLIEVHVPPSIFSITSPEVPPSLSLAGVNFLFKKRSIVLLIAYKII
jgi:hypothetical protein